MNLKSIFPFFILYFIGASLIITVTVGLGVPASVFAPFKELSKFDFTENYGDLVK